MKQKAMRADVEISRSEDNNGLEVGFYVVSSDGKPLTGSQIVEAVAEAVLLYWPNHPELSTSLEDFDA